MIQIFLQTLILLMNSSTTTTTNTGGLETLLNDNRELFGISTTKLLYLSIVWSFNKCVRNLVSAKSADFGHVVSLAGKLIVGMRGLVATSVRIFGMVIFSCGYLGLFNIMYHLQAEQMTTNAKKYGPAGYFDHNNFTYWNSVTNEMEEIPFEKLYNSSAPTYTKYTVGTLTTGYIGFF